MVARGRVNSSVGPLRITNEVEMNVTERSKAKAHVECSRPKGRPNKRLHPTGMSLLLIVNLSHDADVSRRVNRGVMSPLHVQI